MRDCMAALFPGARRHISAGPGVAELTDSPRSHSPSRPFDTVGWTGCAEARANPKLQVKEL